MALPVSQAPHRQAPRGAPLRLDGVSYRVGGAALLHAVSAEIPAGARTVLLGPNGAGKSLLLRICHGLLRPSAGRVVTAGQAILDGRGGQAMVFAEPLILRRSVLGNVTYGLRLRGVPWGERRRRAAVALGRVGLAALATRPAGVLSSGERQRLALARAWALAPALLFLDEPTASLDPAAARRVEEVINEMHGEGTSILLTTHDLAQARRLADQVLFLHQGRLLARQPAAAFFDQPASPAAAAFLRGELPWDVGADGA